MAAQRGMMALIGALAGGSLFLLAMTIEAEWLAGRAALGAAVLAGVFFGGLLITTGPLTLKRAAAGAAAVALVVAALFAFASFRFAAADGIAGSMLAMVSLAVIAWLPWPFLIAEAGAGWRDYPSLFRESWGIVVRVSVALIFTGIVWLVIFLSHELLSLVGVTLIGAVLDQPPAPWLITGTVLGLAMAVVNELADVLSPGLVLRLLRLLVPVVLVVMVVFLAALPFRGLDAIFGAVSSAMVLLAMVAAAVTLVTSALDQEDVLAVQSGVMGLAARILAAIVILPAGLAAWAVWLRVNDHGWTPPRLMAATIAALGLGYGILYVAAVIRGRGWMERVRQANVGMAAALIGAAVLWLSVLNPEAISAQSQIRLITAGRLPVDEIDLYAFGQWGRAGEAALATLHERAKTDPALLNRLAAEGETTQAAAEIDATATLRALVATLPLQPDTQANAALRDRILAQVGVWDLQRWKADCDSHLPDGGRGCVLLVADFLPSAPGDEALLIVLDTGGYLEMEGFALPEAALQRHPVTTYSGAMPDKAQGEALISALQHTAPPLAPVPLNQLALPDQPGLVFAP